MEINHNSRDQLVRGGTVKIVCIYLTVSQWDRILLEGGEVKIPAENLLKQKQLDLRPV